MLFGLTALSIGFVGWSVRRSMRRQSTVHRKAIEGEHELEITDHDLIERSKDGDMRSHLRGIEKIVKSDGYLLIYITSMSAHVVPLGRILEGNVQLFQDALENRVAAAKAASTHHPS